MLQDSTRKDSLPGTCFTRLAAYAEGK